jgi:DNA-directed RNA polymerase specialized sigma subunit, sigma24 homolog
VANNKEETPAKINVEAARVVAALQAGDDTPFLDIFSASKAKFLNWAARRFYSNTGYFEDAWQEAGTIFYERAKSNRLPPLTCKVYVFLFAVGKMWLLKNNRKLKRIWWTDEVDKALLTDSSIAAFQLEDNPWESEREILLAAMNLLGPRCREMLKMRHYDGRSIEEIMIEFDFKNKNVTSASLADCKNKLEEIIKILLGK